jgi:hypothetical protein
MKISFGDACFAEERLNATDFTQDNTSMLRDLIYIYAFNSGLEVADNLEEQLQAIKEYNNELVMWGEND